MEKREYELYEYYAQQLAEEAAYYQARKDAQKDVPAKRFYMLPDGSVSEDKQDVLDYDRK